MINRPCRSSSVTPERCIPMMLLYLCSKNHNQGYLTTRMRTDYQIVPNIHIKILWHLIYPKPSLIYILKKTKQKKPHRIMHMRLSLRCESVLEPIHLAIQCSLWLGTIKHFQESIGWVNMQRKFASFVLIKYMISKCKLSK